MTTSRRQIATHAASAGAGAAVTVGILLLLQGLIPQGGPTAHLACPPGSEFFREFEAGPYVGWKACITFLPAGTDFSLWNVTAKWDPVNGSVVAFVYHYDVYVTYEAFLHQNITYIESHEPVVYWNNTQASAIGGPAGETVRFELFIPSLLYYGDDLSVVREVRFYLAKHEPPVYDPANEPHSIVSDIVSIAFLPPTQGSAPGANA